MSWRTAKSLLQLRREVDVYRPGRSTVSDGTIGDADHRTRTSDHNPWVPPPDGGVVTAMDITDDGGTLTNELAEILRTSRDPRIKYVIGERRMFSSYPTSSYPAWTWRPYSGANAHTSHMHVSVQPDPDLFDSTAPWGIATSAQEDDMVTEPEDVRYYQGILAASFTSPNDQAGPPYDIGPIDGIVGPRTADAIRDWQRRRGIKVTGTLTIATCNTLQSHANRAHATDEVRRMITAHLETASHGGDVDLSGYSRKGHTHTGEVTVR